MKKDFPDAMILVGGAGTRLRSVVSDRPKPLAEVGGRPFLAYLLDGLQRSRRCVLCSGYMAGVVRKTFGDRFGTLEILHSVEASPLGTAGAIAAGLSLTRSNPVLVLNGDSVVEVDVAKMLAAHRASGARATLAAVRVPDASRYGRLDLDDDAVAGFLEKQEGSGPGWINAGVYLFARELVESLPIAPGSLEREVLPALGRDLHAFRTRGRFLDIGTPESYAAFSFFTKRQPS